MKRWQFWVGILISVVFLYFALRGMELSKAWQALRTADYWWLIPGVALYIFIGAIPCTGWLDGVLRLDEYGFIKTGDQLHPRDGHLPSEWAALNREPFLFESSLPGVFVVGDARSGSIKRVASAVGEGSVAVQFIHQYLAKLK